jgi:DNA-binding transcriptional ArsR family regulator
MPSPSDPDTRARGIREVELADTVFAALAHPTRRQILLSVHYRGSAKAGEIARRFDCSWPTTSRHLSTLVASGLLTVTQAGRERIYRTDAELLRGVLETWAGHFSSEQGKAAPPCSLSPP